MISRTYVKRRDLAGYYRLHINTIGKIIKELENLNPDAVLHIGRAVRIDVEKFDEFIKRRTLEHDTDNIQV